MITPQNVKKYHEVQTRDVSRVEDILVQLKAIKTFPSYVTIYDRTFGINNRDELVCFSYGLEIGWFRCLDHLEKVP